MLTESRSSLIASPPAATSAVKKSAIAGNTEPQQMVVHVSFFGGVYGLKLNAHRKSRGKSRQI